MCTVTFIPSHHKIFLTHNRDEKIMRAPAVPPQKYVVGNQQLLFPKDGKAGGSWIGVNGNGQAAVLLNGAFLKHTPEAAYRKSRGLVFLDLLASAHIHDSYTAADLCGIEPFTVILWNGSHLSECRWDGERKHVKSLSPRRPHIWSSSTLYEEQVMETRSSWFSAWLHDHATPSSDDILNFHKEGGDGDTRNDLRINRENILVTLSITSVEMNKEKAIMKYIDLADESVHHQELHFIKAPVNS